MLREETVFPFDASLSKQNKIRDPQRPSPHQQSSCPSFCSGDSSWTHLGNYANGCLCIFVHVCCACFPVLACICIYGIFEYAFCMCFYVCVCLCLSVSVSMCTYLCVCFCVFPCVPVLVLWYLSLTLCCESEYIPMYTCVPKCDCVYLSMFLLVCVSLCFCVLVCISMCESMSLCIPHVCPCAFESLCVSLCASVSPCVSPCMSMCPLV